MSIDKLKDLNEKELNRQLWDAIEMQYGHYIKLIKLEMSRRVREV